MTETAHYDSIYKVGYAEPEASQFSFPDIFARESRKGTPLLCVATSGSQVELLKKLVERMPEPLWMLYVLRIPRGEAEPGRYQTTDTFLRIDVRAFLDRYRGYLECDARHNFWIKSVDGPALLVLDEHNLIYCYGPVDEWANELETMGWKDVKEDELILPDPHQHNYHAVFDDDARRVLGNMEWTYSPLQVPDK